MVKGKKVVAAAVAQYVLEAQTSSGQAIASVTNTTDEGLCPRKRTGRYRRSGALPSPKHSFWRRIDDVPNGGTMFSPAFVFAYAIVYRSITSLGHKFFGHVFCSIITEQKQWGETKLKHISYTFKLTTNLYFILLLMCIYIDEINYLV